MHQLLCELFSILSSEKEHHYLSFMDKEPAIQDTVLVQCGNRIQNCASVFDERLFWLSSRKILFNSTSITLLPLIVF